MTLPPKSDDVRLGRQASGLELARQLRYDVPASSRSSLAEGGLERVGHALRGGRRGARLRV